MENDELKRKIQDLETILVCKIMTEKHINPEIFKAMIPKIWNMERKVIIKKAGENMFECTFNNIHDKRKILDGSP